MDHAYALRAPWYVRAREGLTPFDAAARRPALQKYGGTDFVDRLLADPRDSLAFVAEDRWGFPVPVSMGGKGSGRLRFVDRAMVRSPLRKLYQPLHERFYTVVVELFCDEPGLPRAGGTEGVDLSFVIRRERTLVHDTRALRELARGLALALYTAQTNSTAPPPTVPESDDLDDVAFVGQAAQLPLTPAQQALLAKVRPRRVVEAWVPGPVGTGLWRRVDESAPAALLDGELELPMWQLPPNERDCAAARTRSLWFGVVPTHSADIDELGLPRLDDRTIYRVRCLARQHPGAGHEQCPDRLSWSEPTAPYRLAPHADPEGTKNHRVTITMPDLRAVAARAARPPGPGGVEIVQPPGSQLRMNPGSFPPTPGPPDHGSVTSRCTFAIELFMIVSMFVFSLFLPVVVFVFQLWWLLLLRFCLPSEATALETLESYLDGGGTLGDLLIPKADKEAEEKRRAQLATLDDVFETTDAATQLNAVPTFRDDPSQVGDLVAGLDPAGAALPGTDLPETKPDDPLCPR
ncbi:hypothetical protein [Streptomyces kanamyceticus]|uniref:Uncharacterized protein n=1 Tax=Streptomyces kanamyceticus TaxID=1967 RepID=A0A5J6GQH9_STRKN|nr:hypothetical protein [Streptomyces kanamyceticus]QEU96634.1 hypothetical protein CP970_41905 [Streptomyces kanamyceticus]